MTTPTYTQFTVRVTLKHNNGSFGIKYERLGEFVFCAQSVPDARAIAGPHVKGSKRSIDTTRMVEVVGAVSAGRIYCGDRDRGCGAELTPADLEAGCCTQCHEPLVAQPLPLEHALLLSLSELQSQREAA